MEILPMECTWILPLACRLLGQGQRRGRGGDGREKPGQEWRMSLNAPSGIRRGKGGRGREARERA